MILKKVKSNLLAYCGLIVAFAIACEIPDELKGDSIDRSDNGGDSDWEYLERNCSLSRLSQCIREDQAVYHYQTYYSQEEGQTFFESGQLKILIDKFDDHVDLQLEMDLSELGPIPTVYNTSFSKEEDADELQTILKISNSQNKEILKTSRQESLNLDQISTFSWSFYLSDFKTIKEGMINFEVDIDTRFISFFGVPSKVHPIRAKIAFLYFVPPIYESVVYFDGLQLNEQKTLKLLGNNDWNNSTPEAGISISYGNQNVIYSYTKNSFSNSRKEVAKIYHTHPLDSILIQVLDVDYGFNGDDLIADTVLSIQSLVAEKSINIPLRAVDKLLIRTRYNGKVN